MNLSLFAGSPFFAAHKDRLLAQGLAFVGAEQCFATAFPDGSWLGVERNLDATANRIAALSPADAQRWRAMVAAFAQDAPHLFALLASPLPSWQALRAVFTAWRSRGTAWVADTARLLVASPREWLDENFENAKLKTMMAVWGMHLDFAPDCAGGALFPYLESMANQSFGMALGQGGADTIISAMVRAIAAAGGEVRLGTPVRNIALEAGAATGVVLASGERIEAKRAVIANLHPRVLFGELVSPSSGGGATARKTAARPGDDDDPSGAQRSAELGRRGRAAEVRLCASRAVVRGDGQDLYRGARRAAAGRAGAGGRAADGDRSIARAGRAACAVGAGARIARAHPRRCGAQHPRHALG